jgi:geranylgeranyl pyrophosphate synthase
VQAVVQSWQPESVKSIVELLAKYDTLSGSLEIFETYLQRARASLEDLPHSTGRSNLAGLTEYLARQTRALEVVA